MARRELDFYPTDRKLTQELLAKVPISGSVFECCAGEGHITTVLKESPAISKVMTNDINSAYKHDFNVDASISIYWKASKWNWFDWVVTNPPYKDVAPQIIPLAFESCNIGIAMLLRASYLEPCINRGKWLDEHRKNLTNIIIFGQPRPSFTGDGKVDTSTTAWLVWEKKPKQQGTELHFVYDWK